MSSTTGAWIAVVILIATSLAILFFGTRQNRALRVDCERRGNEMVCLKYGCHCFDPKVFK